MGQYVIILFLISLMLPFSVEAKQRIYDELSMEGNKITSVDTPTSGQDAANKTYVDNNIASNVVTPGGSNKQYQLNDSGLFSGNSSLIYSGGAVRVGAPLISTGDIEIIKPIPELKLTTSGDSDSTRLFRVNASSKTSLLSTVMKPAGPGNALIFDGSNESVEVADFDEVGNSDQELSIFFWINGNKQSARFILSHAETNNDRGWYFATIGTGSEKIRFVVSNDGSSPPAVRKIYDGSIDILDETWHSIGISFNAGVLKIYFDGVEDTSVTKLEDDAFSTIWNSSATYLLGGININGTPSNLFIGTLDEIAIYSLVLPDNDFSDLHAAGNGLIIVPGNLFPTDSGDMGTGLELVLHLDESIGSTASDSSGNNRDGTLNNMEPEDWVTGLVNEEGTDNEVTVLSHQNGVDEGQSSVTVLGDPANPGEQKIVGDEISFWIGTSMKVSINADGTVTIDNGEATAEALVLTGAAGQTVSVFTINNSIGAPYITSGDGLAGSVFAGNEQGVNIDWYWKGSRGEKLLWADAGDDEVRFGNGASDTTYSVISSTGDQWYVGATSGVPYGEIAATSISTETVITSTNVLYQIVIFDTDMHSNMTHTDHTSDHIVVKKPGHYMVNASATVESVAGLGSKFQIAVMKNNGTVEVVPHMDRNIAGGGGAAGVVSLSGIADLAVSDTVEVWIKNETNTANYIVEDISLAIYQLGGT